MGRNSTTTAEKLFDTRLCSPIAGVTNTFAVINKNKVCYLDYTGSGVETIAHIKENGRMTLMMCSYTEKANILRMYGTGRVRAALTW